MIDAQQIESMYFEMLEKRGIDFLNYDTVDDVGTVITSVKPEFCLTVEEMKAEVYGNNN